MRSHVQNTKSSCADISEGDSEIIVGKIVEEAGKVFRSPDPESKGVAEKDEGRPSEKATD
jgi:hypothetical protein